MQLTPYVSKHASTISLRLHFYVTVIRAHRTLAFTIKYHPRYNLSCERKTQDVITTPNNIKKFSRTYPDYKTFCII